MSIDQIMPICEHCGHELLWRYNHWEHRKSRKQQIEEDARIPKPSLHSNCCVECEDIGKRCCNPERKEGKKKGE